MMVGGKGSGGEWKVNEGRMEVFKYLGVWFDRWYERKCTFGEEGKWLEEMGGGGGGLARIGCISRVNGAMEVDRGRLIWELLARSCLEHVSEVWWTRGKEACKNLGKKFKRTLAGNGRVSPPEVPLFVQIIYNNNS